MTDQINSSHIKKIKKPEPKRTVLIVFLAAAILITVFFAIYLNLRKKYFYLSSDYSYMEQSVINENMDRFITVADDYITENITEFEDRNNILSEIKKDFNTKGLTFAKSENYTEENPVYTVFSDSKSFFTVALKKSKRNFPGHANGK